MAPTKHKLVKHPASSQVAKPRTTKHKKRQPTMVVSNAVTYRPLPMTWFQDLQFGPNERLKVDHDTIRTFIVQRGDVEDNSACEVIYGLLMGLGFLDADPIAIHKWGEVYLSKETLYYLAQGSEDMKFGVFMDKLKYTYGFSMAGGKPPVGCVEMPFSCFVERGYYGKPGPLGHSLYQLFKEVKGQGLDEDSVNVFASQYYIHHRDVRYNRDGSVVAKGMLKDELTLSELFKRGLDNKELVRNFALQHHIPTDNHYHADGRIVVLPIDMLVRADWERCTFVEEARPEPQVANPGPPKKKKISSCSHKAYKFIRGIK
jgi:hypothetical protein